MTLRIRWHTDTHLNFATSRTIAKFIESLQRESPDALLLTGDISDGWRIESHLQLIASSLECPVYFVLGNHDFYFSGFSGIIKRVQKVVEANSNLFWLTESDPIKLTDDSVLIGTEGWYDARIGNVNSVFWCGLGDWTCIPEMSRAFVNSKAIKLIKKLSEYYASMIKQKLFKAIEQGFTKIIIATHIPPWNDEHRIAGSFLGSFWSAYDTSIAMGNAIELIAAMFPKIEFTVLAGHIHYHRKQQITENINLIVRDSGIKNFGELVF